MKHYELTKEEREILSAVENGKLISRPKSELRKYQLVAKSTNVSNKIKKEIYYKCVHCNDEIFWNTHKKLTYCKCKAVFVDGCEFYVRIGGSEKDYKVVEK